MLDNLPCNGECDCDECPFSSPCYAMYDNRLEEEYLQDAIYADADAMLAYVEMFGQDID